MNLKLLQLFFIVKVSIVRIVSLILELLTFFQIIVPISISQQDQQNTLIKVTEPPANVQRAEDALVQKEEKEDYILNSHELPVEVDQLYHCIIK